MVKIIAVHCEYQSLHVCVSRRVSHIVPGRYGYGRAPYVAPLQTDTGRGSKTSRLRRQRRSAAAISHYPTARVHSVQRSNNLDTLNNGHRFSKPYIHPRLPHIRNNQVWAPLYQPTSTNQAEVQQEMPSSSQTSGHPLYQERPYDPLPSSSCTGEHAHYRICNSNVRKFAFSPYSQSLLLQQFVMIQLKYCPCSFFKKKIDKSEINLRKYNFFLMNSWAF